MTFRAVKDALHLREIAARVMGLERRMKEPLVRFDFANLIENGGFDADANWVKVGTTISSGKALMAGNSSIEQTNIAGLIDLYFSMHFTISDYASGSLKVNSASGKVYGSAIFGDGIKVVTDYADRDNIKLLRMSSDFTGSIDNVSLWEADPADNAPWLRLKYGYSVSKTGMIVRDGLILHPSEYSEINRDGQTFIKPLVAPGHDTEFSIWAGVDV